MAGLNVTIDEKQLDIIRTRISQIPVTVRKKHVYIALMAGGGAFLPDAKAMAPKETGLLKAAQGVKAGIPNKLDRQPWAIVGAKRFSGRFVRRTKRGKTRRATERFLGGLSQEDLAVVNSVREKYRKRNRAEREAKKLKDAAGKKRLSPLGLRWRAPTRYAHLMNKKTGYLTRAQAANEQAALKRVGDKLAEPLQGSREWTTA